MRKFARTVAAWFSLTSERGVTAIEYGLIASLIAVVIIAGITLIGTNRRQNNRALLILRCAARTASAWVANKWYRRLRLRFYGC